MTARIRTARELSRSCIRAFGLTALTSALACVFFSHCIWNWTPSLPLGLYWLSPGVGKRAELVAFPVPDSVRALVAERHYLPCRALLIKPIVAQAGDDVCTDGGTLTVNEEPVGAIAARDSAGRPLPHPDFCGSVPEGLLYVASHHPRSFDSRTFGPIAVRDVRGTVTPIWTYLP